MMAKQHSYSKTTTQDFDLDGDPDSTTFESFRFDKQGNLIEQVYLQDWSGDEVFDYSNVTANTYTKSGDLLTSNVVDDWDNDGVPNSTQSTVNTYKHGLLVRSEYTQDHGADGVPDWFYVQDNTYNKKGLLAETLHQYSNDGDAVFEQVDKVSFGYDGKDLAYEQYDFGNDGTVDTLITYDTLIA